MAYSPPKAWFYLHKKRLRNSVANFTFDFSDTGDSQYIVILGL